MKNIVLGFMIFVMSVMSVFAAEKDAAAQKADNPLWQTPTKKQCQNGIRLATDYIVENCNKYGQFEYRRNLDPKRKYSFKYNLLRHCGAVYALGMAWDKSKDPKVADTISRACNYLLAQGFISPWAHAKGAVAIWDIPGKLKKKVLPGEPIEAKLGGAGLGILAFLAQQRSSGKGEDIAGGLGLFILSMQRLDGSYVCKVQAGNLTDTGMESLYYPGEAMLGLMRLYEKDGDSKWLESVAKGLKYLAETRKKSGQYPADHWVLIASAAFAKHMDKLENCPITREELVEHAEKICALMVHEQLFVESIPLEFGSFREGGCTCPTAIRVEGMSAALTFIKDDRLKGMVRTSIALAVNFLLRSQVKEGPVKGGFPRSTRKLPLVLADAQSMNRRMGEVRIDYVQHALSAIDSFMDLEYVAGQTE